MRTNTWRAIFRSQQIVLNLFAKSSRLYKNNYYLSKFSFKTPKMVPTFKTKGGLNMPAIGYGTWQATDDKELVTALNHALEAGYRHIDTAYAYGNEHIIGRIVKEWIAAGKLTREDVFITTKLPMHGIHPDRVEWFMKTSLENLGLDYVDLYLIHFAVGAACPPDYSFPPLDSLTLETMDYPALWKKMEEQVDAGRTKHIGLSNYNSRQIGTILNSARIKPSCLQIELSVFLQQTELVDYCHQNDIVVVAYCPLGAPGYNKFWTSIGNTAKELPNMLQDPQIKKIADKHKKSNAQVLLRFLFQKQIIPIPKSVTPSRITENFEIFDFTLSNDDMKILEGLNVGEDARVCDWSFYPPLMKHPEFPWPRK